MASLYTRAHDASRIDPSVRARKDEDLTFGAIERGQESLEGAVKGYGEILRPEFAQMIGSSLGSLNSIGALRSGATVQALDDIGTDYANRVGAFAATTAAEGANIGLRTREISIAEKARRDAARASLLSSLGSVLGAGIGFAAAGPAGAAVGSKVGGLK